MQKEVTKEEGLRKQQIDIHRKVKKTVRKANNIKLGVAKNKNNGVTKNGPNERQGCIGEVYTS